MGVIVVLAAFAAGTYISSHLTPSTAPLSLEVAANLTAGPHPFAVHLTAEAAGGQPPYSYAWTLGDGTTAAGAAVNHTYLAWGTFVATAVVTDRSGASVVASRTLHVLPAHRQSSAINATNQTLGPGGSHAWVAPVTVPTTAASAWLNGTVRVTGCSLSGNCRAFAEVLSVSDMTNLTKGGTVSNPVWCSGTGGNCTGVENVSFSVALQPYAGETLYFVVYNSDTVWSQTVSAHAQFSVDY